jgi:hypothetical protein
MTMRVKVLVTAGAVMLATTFGAAASEEAGSGPNGLYRDMDGGLWCGGSCMPGQQCCRILLVTTSASTTRAF